MASIQLPIATATDSNSMSLGGFSWRHQTLITSLSCGAAMAFIIPISTMVYAAVGGLKATFTTSYMHSVIIFVVCMVFMFQVYVPNNLLGGIDDVSSTT